MSRLCRTPQRRSQRRTAALVIPTARHLPEIKVNQVRSGSIKVNQATKFLRVTKPTLLLTTPLGRSCVTSPIWHGYSTATCTNDNDRKQPEMGNLLLCCWLWKLTWTAHQALPTDHLPHAATENAFLQNELLPRPSGHHQLVRPNTRPTAPRNNSGTASTWQIPPRHQRSSGRMDDVIGGGDFRRTVFQDRPAGYSRICPARTNCR